jgi:hypothetical protein
MLSGPLNRAAMIMAGVIILTSSFDMFLVIQAGGNYRLCQVAAALLLALAVLRTTRARRMPTLGALPLVIWLVFQILFIPVSDFWPKSVGYCLWLMLNLGMMFSFVQLFSNRLRSLTVILRWYCISFALIAAFGILQFALPLFGYGGPLVAQWWIQDYLARANGFSYEPSYFATYLLIGVVFVGSLRRAHSPLLPAKSLAGIYWITAAGIIVSSSRMGIVFMFSDIILHSLTAWAKVFKDLAHKRIVLHTLKALVPSIICLALAAASFSLLARILESNPTIALRFLNGTGLSDTAAHSVVQREDSLEDTVSVFLQHPIIGQSLGGVSSAIADMHGERIKSFEESKAFEGMNVFAEALAASGVLGIIPFLWFLGTTIRSPLLVASQSRPFYATLLRSLVRSLVFGWAILQLNQNMLRPYLWVHLAILAAVYCAALRAVDGPGTSPVRHTPAPGSDRECSVPARPFCLSPQQH